MLEVPAHSGHIDLYLMRSQQITQIVNFKKMYVLKLFRKKCKDMQDQDG